MIVLGLETSCDETACAVVKDGQEILSNVYASQHDIHSRFGGVFPEHASRRHADVILPIIDQALKTAGVTLSQIDLISVAYGPGLMGALMIGLNVAKTLAFTLEKPLVGVNHVEAHLYAALMSHSIPPQFPCLGLVLSGAHSHIFHLTDISRYTLLGQTVDDALGEAFDKVAKIMGIPYPGGPAIELLARSGNPNRHSFKSGRIKDSPLDFSFSGIKTAVLYTIKGQNGMQSAHTPLAESDKADIAASFQHAVFRDVIQKTLRAARERDCRSILFGGGVTNNRRLKEMFAQEAAESHALYWPSAGLSLDNAAMVAGLGYHQFLAKGPSEIHNLEAQTRIQFRKE